MPSLGPSVPLAFWLWLLPTCLPASGGEWAGLQSDSSPLVKPSPLFCERVWQCLRLELFTGKFSLSLLLFFPLSLLSHSLDFYLVSSLRLPLGYSSPFLILSNAAYASLFRPRLLVAVASIWATSPLKAANRCIICGVFFSLPVMLPSENQKFPTDPPVRRFPGIWKLLLFHDSLPGTGLHP